jgi:hypothetical protein
MEETYIRQYDIAELDEGLCDDLIQLCDERLAHTDAGVTNYQENYRTCDTVDMPPSSLRDRVQHVLKAALMRYAADTQDLGYMKNLATIEVPRVLRYEPSEGHFSEHADTWNYESALRQLSAVIYLNDVEEGGETVFPRWKCTVRPKKGTIALFPPFFTHSHYAAPPQSSRKYALVTWFTFPDLTGQVAHYLTI